MTTKRTRTRTRKSPPPPPTGLPDKKEKPVMVRLSELEFADFHRLAVDGGYKLATWIRYTCNRVASGRHRQLLGELKLELEWIRSNVRAVAGEVRAVDESWGNVERAVEELRGRF